MLSIVQGLSVTHVIKVRLSWFCTECSVAWPCFVSSAGAWLPACPFPCLFSLWSACSVVTCSTILSELLPAHTFHLSGNTKSSLLHATCLFGELQWPSPARLGNRLQQTSDRLFFHGQPANLILGSFWELLTGWQWILHSDRALEEDRDVAGKDKSRVRGQCCWELSL